MGIWDSIFGGGEPQYDPNNPETWSPDQRVAYLGSLGLQWVGGEGANAVWQTPDGKRLSEKAALDLTLGTYSEANPINPPTAQKQAGAPDQQYDAQGQAWQWNGQQYVRAPQFDNPTKAAGYRAPSTAAPTPPQSFVDRNGDRVGINPFTGQEVYRIPGAEYAQLSPQEQQRIREAEAQTARDFNRGERIAGQDFSAGQAQAGRDFTRGENATSRAFQQGESATQRAFQAGESDIDRAIRAAEFASNYNLGSSRFEFDQNLAESDFNRRKSADSLAAAKQYADLINTVDPNAFDAFLRVGGGNIGNAIAAGSSAVSDRANLPSARSARTLDDINANAFRRVATPAPLSVGDFTRHIQRVPLTMQAQPPAPVLNTPAPIAAGAPASTAPATGAGFNQAANNAAIIAAAQSVGIATPGFANGTNGFIPAPHTFITGDSPAGTPTGWEEMVNVIDPPGPNNAMVRVRPSANTRALVAPRFAMGTALPGEEITAADQPYLSQVADFRRNAIVPDFNPFDVGFRNVNPFSRASYFQARQTRYGIPVAAQEFEAQRYQVPGMGRSVMYGQGY